MTGASSDVPTRTLEGLVPGMTGHRAIQGSLLVAGDADDRACGPLHLAELLARRDRIRAHVLGVVAPIGWPIWEHIDVDAEVLEDARRRQYLNRLRQHVYGTVGRSAHFSVDVVTGSAASALVDAARSGGAAYILVGVAEHGAASRAATEDTALQLARIGAVPVLAVPWECVALPKRALVATDFSPPSIRAAHATLGIMAAGGTVTFAHVEPDEELRVVSDPGWAERYERSVASLFGDLVAQLGHGSDMTLETVLLHGDPVRALLDRAVSAGHDLIAVGTQSMVRSMVRITGSVSAGVLHGARTTVLLAPPVETPA